jgi:flagellar hook assembly protein FlgD
VTVAGPAHPLFLSVQPNPVRTTARFRVYLPRPGEAVLRIFDATGRRVAQVRSGSVRAGTAALAWDATDGSGRRVREGVYISSVWVDGREVPGPKFVVLH